MINEKIPYVINNNVFKEDEDLLRCRIDISITLEVYCYFKKHSLTNMSSKFRHLLINRFDDNACKRALKLYPTFPQSGYEYSLSTQVTEEEFKQIQTLCKKFKTPSNYMIKLFIMSLFEKENKETIKRLEEEKRSK